MRLEDVTAEIRPRMPWESIDLGCALARRHLGAVIKAWSLTVVPLWVILAVLLRNHPILFILCVWWLKPLYDRVPLLVLSHALFGAVPSVKEVVVAWPKLLVSRLWFALVIGRFSPARSLSLPVAELEGLRGQSYRQRVDLLERNGGEGATMATLAGLVLEAVTAFGMIMLVMMMMPDEVSNRWVSSVEDFFVYSEISEISDGLIWMVALVQMLAITLMEPFYVSAGFALYINSRTLTEGWDIELAFKRLGARLADTGGKVMMLLLAVVCVGWSTPVAHAEQGDGVSSAHESIQRVMADEDFTVHHRYVDVPVKKEGGSWLEGLFSNAGVPAFMGTLGMIVFYLVLVAGVVGLVYLIYSNRHIFGGDKILKHAESRRKTTSVMGMEVAPDSLPDDVVDAARKSWRDGDYQGALGLLYRGSIVWMIHRADVPIEESDTEGDCLFRAQQLPEEGMVTYFADLTQQWVDVAYGKKTPDDHALVDLCDRWPFRDDYVLSERRTR